MVPHALECAVCGFPVSEESAGFCAYCGTATPAVPHINSKTVTASNIARAAAVIGITIMVAMSYLGRER